MHNKCKFPKDILESGQTKARVCCAAIKLISKDFNISVITQIQMITIIFNSLPQVILAVSQNLERGHASESFTCVLLFLRGDC